MFKMSIQQPESKKSCQKKWMGLISNALNMWKMFAMQINEFVSEVFALDKQSLHYSRPLAQMTNQRLKLFFWAWFMKKNTKRICFS